ncbi:hypothetical protein H072_5151 [Dactylellina haptotyla CBS 200.50]|uniref:galacturonan 1,4-alpha-galacturonidase n=1 Tax=Dactylellina haptotyla (strain CBS 200.50) TaxID=1284197 RepID=S8ADF5_DACHA|nr:hypothetical protein H072_5151 [Dactylellina haptotyla CBS 200.50]
MQLKATLLSLLLVAQNALATEGTVSHSTTHGRKTCTVYAYKIPKDGKRKDDVPNLLKAFKDCGDGGYIKFPAGQNYWIAQRLNPVLNNVKIDWAGTWTFSDDLGYWRNNSYYVKFQNHRAGFAITGDDIIINGFGTGGIDGNGNAWYEAEKGVTQPGRPMPFVFWNVSQVTVTNFSVKQPPLWAINIMNGTNMYFSNITANATAYNAPWGTNWVQNTDGFDTMDARNIHLEHFTYQGGDDCIAIKPRSYDIHISDVTCRGGNGIAIGSLGQYLEDSSVENVKIDNVRIVRYNDDMHNCAYIKTWIGFQAPQSGYESEGQPRGGGWGYVRNVLFSNFDVQGADNGPALTQDNGNNGSYAGTSKMLVSNIVWANFTGYTHGGRRASVGCSKVNPCYNIAFEGLDIIDGTTGQVAAEKCTNIASHGVRGLDSVGCNV